MLDRIYVESSVAIHVMPSITRDKIGIAQSSTPTADKTRRLLAFIVPIKPVDRNEIRHDSARSTVLNASRIHAQRQKKRESMEYATYNRHRAKTRLSPLRRRDHWLKSNALGAIERREILIDGPRRLFRRVASSRLIHHQYARVKISNAEQRCSGSSIASGTWHDRYLDKRRRSES